MRHLLVLLLGAFLPGGVANAQTAKHDHHGHQMEMPTEAAPPTNADPHAGHDMNVGQPDDSEVAEVGNAPPPKLPLDHAADAIYGREAMAEARSELSHEVGGMGYSLVMVDLFELSARSGRDQYRFEGEAFSGGNINRYGIKFEGEGEFKGPLDDLEVQGLYSRAVAPYWNAQIGVRHDVRPDPQRTYLVAGLEGIAPYWFKLNAAGFVSTKGEVRARFEASYDQRITNALILQPRIEANLSFQHIRSIGIGSGLSDFEAGLRLRYEIAQEFAPYVGVEWRAKTGETRRFARLAGDDPTSFAVVAGVRFWF